MKLPLKVVYLNVLSAKYPPLCLGDNGLNEATANKKWALMSRFNSVCCNAVVAGNVVLIK